MVMIAAVLLLSFIPVPVAQAPQTPPRDAVARTAAQRERDLRAAIAAGGAPEASYTQLAELLNARNDSDGADAILLAARAAYPKSIQALTAAAGVYNRRGEFEPTIEALRAIAALQPQSAEARHRIGTFFQDKARAVSSDPTRDPAAALSYVMKGLEAEDEALLLQPDYAEALTYKSVLLRLQANLSPDPGEKARLIAEADALRSRVLAMQREKGIGSAQPPAPAAVPETPWAGFDEPFDQAMARLTPVRVGGNIPMPSKLKDVKPRYPAEAQDARVSGVVIVEALVDVTGKVANARVLRSIPSLDAAALEAVSQWVFTPTELDGRAVPIVLTVTVNFTVLPR